MSQIPHHPDGPQQKKGMSGCAIAAIVLGIVGVVLLILVVALVALLLPAVSRARENAMQIMGGVQARQIAQSLMQYRADNQRYPDADTWADDLIAGTYAIEEELFWAVNSDSQQRVYFFVPQDENAANPNDPTTILVYEHPDVFERGGNIAYADGHVEFIAEPQFSQIINALTLPDGTPYAPHTAVVLPAE